MCVCVCVCVCVCFLMFIHSFLGEFAKPGKATISLVISARLSVRMIQLGYQPTDFHEILYMSVFFFENRSRKFKFH